VQFRDAPAIPESTSGSVLLAKSYYAQSRFHLAQALQFAREATQRQPKFGFAWARLAELQFAFGERKAAEESLGRAMKLSPVHAQAMSTWGFVLAAKGDFSGAQATFNRAITLDSALGNAWLGRGLANIRGGHLRQGREDLLVAAALEPNRAVLRSYLGKAFAESSHDDRAAKELKLAQRIDPKDPTSWLYAALLNEQRNRINEAIDDLEHSIELNNNRQLYRSRLLLDEDRAVRGANLARLYEDAGLTDLAFREAARSANIDYADFSSHLFLANSYNQLRDPKQINLRYETPWLSEYVMANLLAPVEAGTLSQNISDQEYGRLFERNRLGLVSSTEYRSRGDWAQGAAQYGIYNNFAYSLDEFYRSQNGYRPNNDLDQLTLSLQLKQRVTPDDNAYFQAVYYRATSGDLRQYYDQNSADRDLRVKETQEPLLLGGWNHQWGPEHNTLFLVGRFQDSFSLRTTNASAIDSQLAFGGSTIPSFDRLSASLNYRNDLDLYTTELQHIWQHNPWKIFGGVRYQAGTFDTGNQLAPAPPVPFVSPTNGSFSTDLERFTLYGYGHWQAADSLLLIGGLTYDWLRYPENFRNPPIAPTQARADRFSPKAGLIWTPFAATTLRAAYTRSLGGVSFDQSFQLEPSQIAGFQQSFRSLIPESISGALSAQKYETIGVALDQKFPTRTYAGISAEMLRASSAQTLGAYSFVLTDPNSGAAFGLRESLRFTERSLLLSLNQLVGKEWSFGARYRLTRADLDDAFPGIPAAAPLSPTFQGPQHPVSTLHQLNLFAIYNHPCGFFSQAQALWSAQDNSGYAIPEPGDDFWHFNFLVGYRFPERRAEISFGLLNLTDRDYRLSPLTLYSELPRRRTAVVNFKFYF
jgi:tetratricopeptide (TPR) repeat protein